MMYKKIVNNRFQFQLDRDALAMYSEGCPNAIIQTSNILKSEIQVPWIAPPSGSGCLRFK